MWVGLLQRLGKCQVIHLDGDRGVCTSWRWIVWCFQDVILAELLSSAVASHWIVNYHEHDSLLENRPEENLSEDERKAAWDEYEREKLGVYISSPFGNFPGGNFPNSGGYTTIQLPRVAPGHSLDSRSTLVNYRRYQKCIRYSPRLATDYQQVLILNWVCMSSLTCYLSYLHSFLAFSGAKYKSMKIAH